MPQEPDPPLTTLLGTGAEAEVYALGDDLAVKLFHEEVPEESIRREAATLAALAAHDIPAPRLHEVRRFGARLGIVMTRAAGPSFGARAEAEPAMLAPVLAAMAALHVALHAKHVPELRPLKNRMAERIAEAAPLADKRRTALVASLAGLPDDDRLCHGDFHPYNILGPLEAPVIVDWMDATSGDPAADVCRSWLLMSKNHAEVAEAYVEAYVRASGMARAAIFAWLPVVAAVRIAEDVPDEVDRLLALADGALGRA